MQVPRWAQYAGGATIVAALGALLLFREKIVAAAVLTTPGTAGAPLPTPLTPGQSMQIVGDPIRLVKGRTYFAVLHTTGAIDAAANPDRVKAEAAKQGFSDVSVSRTRPAGFPGFVAGDYFVKATYQGDDRAISRKQTVFLGSVTIVDAWVAAS